MKDCAIAKTRPRPDQMDSFDREELAQIQRWRMSQKSRAAFSGHALRS